LFIFTGQAVIKQVHQPGLAAADATPKVQAGYRFTLLVAKIFPPTANGMGIELKPYPVKLADRTALCRIGLVITAVDQGLVNGQGSLCPQVQES